jgi:restriction endonuclease
MKLSKQQLQRIIVEELNKNLNEDALRGIPNFMFQEAARKFVDEVRQCVKKFVLTDKSFTEQEQRDTIAEANAAMQDLEQSVNELLDAKLWKFLQHV